MAAARYSGVNAPVVVGHGISSPEAIKNMILLSKNMAGKRYGEQDQKRLSIKIDIIDE